MSCCQQLDTVQEWYEWEGAQPLEPSKLIAYAHLGGGGAQIEGVRKRVTGFASQNWTSTPFSLASEPVCSALGYDEGRNTSNADQWNFDHLTENTSATLPTSLQKVLFMRGGLHWQMTIPLMIGGPAPLDLVQLSFRDNAGTRGDAMATYPVIEFDASGTPSGFTGAVNLKVTLNSLGRYKMVLWARSRPYGTMPPIIDYSMTEMEWVVVL